MEPFPLNPQPGSSLDPEAVIGRDVQIDEALRQLRNGNNLLITDPRRMGKTALLDRLCAFPGGGVEAVKIDYEGTDSVDEFLVRTMMGLRSQRAVWGRAKETAKLFFDGVEAEVGGIKVKAAFSRKAPEALLTEVVEGIDRHRDPAELLVVAMDEVPLAIDNIVNQQGPTHANQLLQALRRLRRSHPTSMRWIVTGSVGFHHVLRRAGATEGAINDLVNFPLGPLEHKEARFLARCLLLGIGRDADEVALDGMVEWSGAIPFLVHQLAHRLDGEHSDVTVEDVRDAFTAFISDRDESKSVTHLLSRIGHDYGPLATCACRLLDVIALDGPLDMAALERGVGRQAPSRDELLEVLDKLCDDHYLVSIGELNWRWRYEILRRIWVYRRCPQS